MDRPETARHGTAISQEHPQRQASLQAPCCGCRGCQTHVGRDMRAGHALRWLSACTCSHILTYPSGHGGQIQTTCVLPRTEISRPSSRSMGAMARVCYLPSARTGSAGDAASHQRPGTRGITNFAVISLIDDRRDLNLGPGQRAPSHHSHGRNPQKLCAVGRREMAGRVLWIHGKCASTLIGSWQHPGCAGPPADMV